jgi:hypothetical protein
MSALSGLVQNWPGSWARVCELAAARSSRPTGFLSCACTCLSVRSTMPGRSPGGWTACAAAGRFSCRPRTGRFNPWTSGTLPTSSSRKFGGHARSYQSRTVLSMSPRLRARRRSTGCCGTASTVASVAVNRPESVRVEPHKLIESDVRPWTELPCSNDPAPWSADIRRAASAGLRCRPLSATLEDVWREMTRCSTAGNMPGGYGMDPAREAAVIARSRPR